VQWLPCAPLRCAALCCCCTVLRCCCAVLVIRACWVLQFAKLTSRRSSAVTCSTSAQPHNLGFSQASHNRTECAPFLPRAFKQQTLACMLMSPTLKCILPGPHSYSLQEGTERLSTMSAAVNNDLMTRQ
jgi:hypothetical protein